MAHILNRIYKGEGITQSIQPACSCGWKGIAYEAHNDWQHTLVADQERDHIRTAAIRQRAERQGGFDRASAFDQWDEGREP